MKKGEPFLRKLLQQDLFISRDQRQLGDALAKGKVAIALGVSFYTLEGFIVANLPVKELPTPKEGLPSSNGSGVIGVVKNAPHPNAARLFVNWLLSKEGQELYVKAITIDPPHRRRHQMAARTRRARRQGQHDGGPISQGEKSFGRQIYAGTDFRQGSLPKKF